MTDRRISLPEKEALQPPLPQQELAPYFAVGPDGRLDFAPPSALDAAGNNRALLEQLHQPLVAASRELVALASGGNQPYELIRTRAAEYLAAIAKPLDGVTFGVVFALGVRLENAVASTRRDREAPPFDAKLSESLNSVLSLHGTFVLSSVDGQQLIYNEQRYNRTPAEQERAREAAISLAKELVSQSDIMVPEAAQFVAAQAQDIGIGNNPERTAMLGGNTVRNAAVVIVAMGMFAAAPTLSALAIMNGGLAATLVGTGGLGATYVINEGLKKSEIGIEAIDIVKNRFNAFVARAGSAFAWFAQLSDRTLARAVEWLIPQAAEKGAKLTSVDNLSRISTYELRSAVSSHVDSMRRFAATMNEAKYREIYTRPGDDYKKQNQQNMLRDQAYRSEYSIRYWPMTKALYEELKVRTGYDGKDFKYSHMEHGGLAGAHPIEESADGLEALARKLPAS